MDPGRRRCRSAPRRTSPTWRQFLKVQACDFMHVDTVLLRRVPPPRRAGATQLELVAHRPVSRSQTASFRRWGRRGSNPEPTD
jgi:hypothetical protein